MALEKNNHMEVNITDDPGWPLSTISFFPV
jgi:hypothetical protein